MMNIDQPIGTRFTLDDGRVAKLMAHCWDGRVRLWVCSWPDPEASKRTGVEVRAAQPKMNQRREIYMTPRAFARRAKLYTTAQADTEGGDREPGDMHN